MTSECDPVGMPEIARRAGVRRDTVEQWVRRHSSRPGKPAPAYPFPEPRWTVGGGPGWNWTDVQAWLVATGRWPKGGDDGE